MAVQNWLERGELYHIHKLVESIHKVSIEIGNCHRRECAAVFV